MNTNDNKIESQASSLPNSVFADYVATYRDVPMEMSLLACMRMAEQVYHQLEILNKEKSEVTAGCLHSLNFLLVMTAVIPAKSRAEIQAKALYLGGYRRLFKTCDPRLFVILNTAIIHECELWGMESVDVLEPTNNPQIH
ncbi:hypothetical protein [Lichenifustis flavocetrariae]|uniref:Uncharacterized protein n=1 Tax=Lichenifustis flavocetrariae TaxID=2949735 RepID=A0AA42CRZ3_9HYPH|nr:hypothetical protein [Lichenifustis flavocetrariae]MCW6512992.1 hypothetical protein [Lichenifustis flavocetrariae]